MSKDGNFEAYLQGGRGQRFEDYAAGNKVYGGGRSNPTSGPVDKTGYKERDAKAKTMRDAALRRLKSRRGKQYMSSANLTPTKPLQGPGV